MGKCTWCFKGEMVYEFYIEPNVGKPAFAYNIQERDGEVKGIFRCNDSSGYERDRKEKRNPNIIIL